MTPTNASSTPVSRNRPAAPIAGLLLAAALATSLPASAQGDAGVASFDSFTGMAAVWTGTEAYLFGGIACRPGSTLDCDPVDAIVRFDPATRAFTSAGRLPEARGGASAAYDGKHVYLFGGSTPAGTSQDILRFDPATGKAERLATAMPEGLEGTSAVWTGQHIYVIGGSNHLGTTRATIQAFDPAAGTLKTLAGKLPHPMSGTATVWTGTEALVMGGLSNGFTWEDSVVRIDGAGKVRVMEHVLPDPLWGTAAVWTGQAAYLFGGSGSGRPIDIVRYVPGEEGEVVDTLPSGRQGAAAVWAGEKAYIFGGGGEALAFTPEDLPAPTSSHAPASSRPRTSAPAASGMARYTRDCTFPAGDTSGSPGADIVGITSRQVGDDTVEIRVRMAGEVQASGATHSLTVDTDGDDMPDLTYPDNGQGSFMGRPVFWDVMVQHEGDELVYPIHGNGFDPASHPGRSWTIKAGVFAWGAAEDRATCAGPASDAGGSRGAGGSGGPGGAGAQGGNSPAPAPVAPLAFAGLLVLAARSRRGVK